MNNTLGRFENWSQRLTSSDKNGKTLWDWSQRLTSSEKNGQMRSKFVTTFSILDMI